MANGRKILVIDVGGTHVKVHRPGYEDPVKIPSGRTMTAKRMVADVKKVASKWQYSAVSIGYPGSVVHGRPVSEPYNLGGGWVGFDFIRAFGHPVKVVNDAAMQALGSYEGGRMLFLGLGTGLGSALIVDGILQSLELAHLPYKKGRTFEDYIGVAGLKRRGKTKWRHYVADVVKRLAMALQADYVVLGGGNAKLLKKLPANGRRPPIVRRIRRRDEVAQDSAPILFRLPRLLERPFETARFILAAVLHASVSGKIFRSDVILVNVRAHKHCSNARNHGRRSGNVIDGSLQVGQMS